MNDAIIGELYFFGVSILSGAVAAVIFDFFRALRKTGEGKKVALEDILFWLCEAILIFYVLYKFNSGGVRFYFFIGIAAGLVIYFFTASKYVVKIFSALLYVIKIVMVKIFVFFQRFFALISRPIVFFLKKTGNIFKKIHSKSKKIKKQLKMY